LSGGSRAFATIFSSIAGAPIAGRNHTPETRAQMSDSHTGLTHSEETRAKMSAK